MIPILEPILGNFVVQILLGIGAMVLLIKVGEAFASRSQTMSRKNLKNLEASLRADTQKEINRMRDEMDALKGTLLEHSMSLDESVENLQRRLDHQEQRTLGGR